jgi:hypothetical protein
VLVDSCLNPESAQPAGLDYITGLGLSAVEAVRLVVATHWDDDHVAGIGKVVDVCSNAAVACSAALHRTDIVQFVIQQEAASGASGSGVDELRTVLRLCSTSGRTLVWAKANLPLYPRPPGDNPSVIALSPSEDAVQRSIESLIEAATGQRITLPRRYRAPDGPNRASVAVSVRRPEATILLGADLEKSRNSEAGWDAVLKYSRPPTRSSVTKVPHHGSVGANHDEFWTDLVEKDVVAIVTPWVKGGRYLPTVSDLGRLRRLTEDVYLTATPRFPRADVERELQMLLRKVHGRELTELRGWGHVRARRRPGESAWRIELGGDAVRVPESTGDAAVRV